MDCAVIYSEATLADLEQITAFIAADNKAKADNLSAISYQLSAINSVKERGRVKQIYAALRSLGRGRRLYVLNYLSRRSPATAGRRRVKPVSFFAFYHEIGQALRFRGGCQTHERNIHLHHEPCGD